MMSFGLNTKRPDSITASCVGVHPGTGVDLGVSVCLQYPGNRTATFVTDLRVDMPCEATVHGKEGAIRLGRKWW